MSLAPSVAALRARSDLMAYAEDQALMLFALELRFNVEDIASVAAVALTDHSNDKKCDLVYVDRHAGLIVFAQSYAAASAKGEAPANKASDLNTAATWLLSGPTDGLPDALKSAAIEVRDALANDEIREIYVWYCHNLPESGNVARELEQVQQTTTSLIRTFFPNASVTSIAAQEIGINAFDELYRRTQAPIIVPNTLEFTVPGGFEVIGDKWRAYCTSVSGKWLRTLWQSHEADLLSPNVREYLGIVKSERNINNGIKKTAKDTPQRFWIYNNGLTILVNSYQVGFEPDSLTQKLTINGIGIINGAQTTGAIGTLTKGDASSLDEVQIMARFVSCGDPEVLADIVKYNNTQNKVEATDFRSKDAVQERLRQEFGSIPDADYRGGRRGGIRDAIERSKNLLADGTVAQSLASFHGRPNLAYNETRRIWEEDAIYASLFSEKTTARHIILTFSLQRAIEEIKKELSSTSEEERTAAQHKYLGFLRRRGSITLLASAIAESLETVTGRVIPDRWNMAFSDNCSPRTATDRWRNLVMTLLPFVNQLSSAADNDLKNNEKVKEALEKFQSMVESTVESNAKIYAEFTANLRW